ncbi:hypothetical protein MauCBS54593_007064 [Microsporum audouinii]
MHCAHCEREFDRVAFDSHCDEHTQIQNRLQRQARTYGARYEPDNTPREPPRQPILSSDQQEPALALRPKEAEVVTPENKTPASKNNSTTIKNFRPYEGARSLKSQPSDPEHFRTDCDFKFRNMSVMD